MAARPEAIRRHLCDSRLGQVHCVEAGVRSSTPLLLLHQTPRSVDEFAEVVPILAAERHVIAMDTPGYGCSDRVPGQPQVVDYAAAALDVLDAFGIERFVPVGHHTGAVIAVELAAGRPERVERAVLSGPVYTDAAGRAELAKLFRQWAVRPDGAHLLDKWQKLARWLPQPELVQRCVVDLFRAGTASEQGHFAVAEYRMEDRLAELRCPALLIYGRDDPFANPAQSAPLHAAFRPGRTTTIAAGIFAPTEAPQAYAQAVLDYLRDPP